MTSNLKVVAQKVLASMTMTATVVSLSGFAVLAPTTALAAVPADYGLREGDTISVDGTPGTAGYDPDIYIVNDLGYKRLFLNPIIFSFYGHLGGYAAVKKVSAAARDAFPTSGLFRNCETNDQRVWGVEVTGEDSGILHWVNTTGAQAAIDDPNFFRKVFCINNNEFNWYPKGADWTSVNQVPDYNRPQPGQSPTPTPTSGGLNGGAGALDSADWMGSLNNEDVGEGENNIAVAGLDLTADNGSDLRLLSVKVSFEEQGVLGGSEDLDDYADEVSLWFGSTKIATVDVADMNEDDVDGNGGNEWSKSISISGNSIIRMDDTEQLKVAVSALDNIDSSDLGPLNNDWRVSIESVRYVDAQGAITTEDSLEDIGDEDGQTDYRSFQFVSFGAAADLELNFDEASDNPESRVVDIDDTSSTDGVVLLTSDLEATGDMDVKEIEVDVNSVDFDVDEIATAFNLEVDGDVVQTLQVSECANPSTTAATCVFDDVDQSIADGDSVKLRVTVDVNGTEDIDGPGAIYGGTLTAIVDVDATVAEDENGDDVDPADLTGSALGEEQAFYSEGIQVSFDSASESKVTSDVDPDLGTFVIKFKVKAFDTDAFVRDDCGVFPPAGVNGEGTIASQSGTGVFQSCSLDNSDATANGNFEVNDGETHTFTLTIATEGANDFVSYALRSINWDDADNLAAAMDQFYTFNLDEFETDALYLAL